ncbi:MAG: DUF2157 domain-containing protein [Pseudomonas sp.]|uniref:DUF2157 domain-containing protein n=1 Tax=Pseudomonas sp. TaxID=306 RepID=UPI003399DC47
MPPLTREQAQLRADRIQVFREELAQLQAEQVLVLEPAQQAAIARHQDQLLAHFAASLGIDATLHARRLSLGMRVASLFGALTLATSLFFLFYQFWGWFAEPVQVAILLGTSLGSLALTVGLQRLDRSGYYSKLAALLCFASFVLNLSMLGQIFNITPSDKALLPWAALALLLAYHCNLRLLLVAGLLCVAGFIAARIGAWGGLYWLSVGDRPENFFPAALLLFLWPSLVDQRRFAGFATLYRAFGLLFLYLPVLVLSFWGESSYLPLQASSVEVLYQCLGYLLPALGIWLGIRRHWPAVTNTSLIFGVLFLYTKLFDWWWDVMPKYLFFLLLGLISVLLLVLLQRWRNGPVAAGGEQ